MGVESRKGPNINRLSPTVDLWLHVNSITLLSSTLFFWPELLLQWKLCSMQACYSRRCKNPSLRNKGRRSIEVILVSILVSWGWESGAQRKDTMAMPYFFQSSLRVVQPPLEGYQLWTLWFIFSYKSKEYTTYMWTGYARTWICQYTDFIMSSKLSSKLFVYLFVFLNKDITYWDFYCYYELLLLGDFIFVIHPCHQVCITILYGSCSIQRSYTASHGQRWKKTAFQ